MAVLTIMWGAAQASTAQGTGSSAGRGRSAQQFHDSRSIASQGLGAPACARLMTSWWSDTERGTVWGVWTASNNVGGFLAPILVGNVARAQGWRCAITQIPSPCSASCRQANVWNVNMSLIRGGNLVHIGAGKIRNILMGKMVIITSYGLAYLPHVGAGGQCTLLESWVFLLRSSC